MSEEYWIEWCKRRTRLYAALAQAFKLVGPPMARKQDEGCLKLFLDKEDTEGA